ncbi:MAG: hypothetical protein J6O39_05370 [Treponema sp.]|nr:hypothetical protein [Treponema sp.]
MLKDFEWNTINNILLELYTIDDIKTLSKKTMNVLHLLITYSKGFFLLIDEDQRIDEENSYFIGFEENHIHRYISTYYNKDYIQYLYDFSKETMVFQDSEMLEDEIRHNTDFYQNFLKPADIPFGSGILVVKNGRIIGIFNLFKSEAQGDFSERDIYILNVLKRHLENIIQNTSRMGMQTILADKCFEIAEKKFLFSDRETEVLKFIADGMSNAEICSKANISISTVKKHIYNIFNKAGVNSRTQLLNLIYSLKSSD